jgi:hypothetical protein
MGTSKFLSKINSNNFSSVLFPPKEQDPVFTWTVLTALVVSGWLKAKRRCKFNMQQGSTRANVLGACRKKIPRYHTIFFLAAGFKLALLIKV